MIFILTNKSDIHPNPVIDQLNKAGYPFFRLNTEDLLTDYDLNFIFEDEFDFSIKNIHNNKFIRKNMIGSIWERRPTPPQIKNNSEERSIIELCEKEAKEFLFWYRYLTQDVYWLGHPIYDRWAGSKIKQLSVAKNLGFNIPKTYIGNNKEELVNQFKNTDSIAIKPISEDWIDYKNEEYAFFTNLVKLKEIEKIDKKLFRNTINYVQEYIPKLFELRVTVVGKEIFSCKIDSQILDEEHGKIDWRQGYESNLSYTEYTLDSSTKKFCLNYLNMLNLNFGCFDFIVTPESQIYFLECNPNGQWLWIEEESGLQISKAIANLLICEDEIRKN